MRTDTVFLLTQTVDVCVARGGHRASSGRTAFRVKFQAAVRGVNGCSHFTNGKTKT